MARKNLVVMIKFFYIIYKALFVFLLATNNIKVGQLGLILNHIAIIETNECKIFYLYCIICLEKASYLAISHF